MNNMGWPLLKYCAMSDFTGDMEVRDANIANQYQYANQFGYGLRIPDFHCSLCYKVQVFTDYGCCKI